MGNGKHALHNENHALSNENHALGNEQHALGNEKHALGYENNVGSQAHWLASGFPEINQWQRQYPKNTLKNDFLSFLGSGCGGSLEQV